MGYEIPSDHSSSSTSRAYRAMLEVERSQDGFSDTNRTTVREVQFVGNPPEFGREEVINALRAAPREKRGVAEGNSILQFSATLAHKMADIIEGIPNRNLDFYRDLCHGRSVDAGWWKDLDNVLEVTPTEHHARIINWYLASKIALIHSEASESLEGLRKGVPDDHLPQYSMEFVEMADLLIRIFDYCGKCAIPIDEIVFAKLAYNADRADHKIEAREAEGGKSF